MMRRCLLALVLAVVLVGVAQAQPVPTNDPRRAVFVNWQTSDNDPNLRKVLIYESMRWLTQNGFYNVYTWLDLEDHLTPDEIATVRNCKETPCVVEILKGLGITHSLAGEAIKVGDTWSLTMRISDWQSIVWTDTKQAKGLEEMLRVTDDLTRDSHGYLATVLPQPKPATRTVLRPVVGMVGQQPVEQQGGGVLNQLMQEMEQGQDLVVMESEQEETREQPQVEPGLGLFEQQPAQQQEERQQPEQQPEQPSMEWPTVQLPSALPADWQQTSFVDSWWGVVDEGQERYPMDIVFNSIAADQVCGTVWYPRQNCGGNLYCLDVATPGKIVVREQLTTVGPCADQGIATFQVAAPNRLTWSWQVSADDPAVIATATVLRKTARPVEGDQPQITEGTATLVGRWEGEANQDHGRLRYPIVFEIESLATDQQCGRVDYPTGPCKARMMCLGPQSADHVWSIEVLDDQGICVDLGINELKLVDQDTVEWRWLASPGAAEPEVVGTLKRVVE